jgi:hypothetical protein
MKLYALAVTCLLCLAGPALAGNISEIDQIGDGNTVQIEQDPGGSGGNLHSKIEQKGTLNSASVQQHSHATLDAQIKQEGTSNSAIVD